MDSVVQSSNKKQIKHTCTIHHVHTHVPTPHLPPPTLTAEQPDNIVFWGPISELSLKK